MIDPQCRKPQFHQNKVQDQQEDEIFTTCYKLIRKISSNLHHVQKGQK